MNCPECVRWSNTTSDFPLEQVAPTDAQTKGLARSLTNAKVPTITIDEILQNTDQWLRDGYCVYLQIVSPQTMCTYKVLQKTPNQVGVIREGVDLIPRSYNSYLRYPTQHPSPDFTGVSSVLMKKRSPKTPSPSSYPRPRISTEHRAKLEELFSISPYPSMDLIKQYADQMGKTEGAVRSWVAKRREK